MMELQGCFSMFHISLAQISMWTWSNALYNSRGNQINIAQITILQLLFTNQIKCWFLMRGENRRKTSHDGVKDQQTQSTYTPSAEIEPGPHWWKASTLTTRPNLPPSQQYSNILPSLSLALQPLFTNIPQRLGVQHLHDNVVEALANRDLSASLVN